MQRLLKKYNNSSMCWERGERAGDLYEDMVPFKAVDNIGA